MSVQESASRKRAACDRCHGQKLRCPRPLLDTGCTRCQRAGAQCIFSASKRGNSGRIFRQQQYSPNVTLDITSTTDTMLYEPPDSCLTDYMEFDTNLSSEALHNGLPFNDDNFLLGTFPEPDTLPIPYLNLTNPSSTAMFDPSEIEPVSLTSITQTATYHASHSTSGLLGLSNDESLEDQSLDIRLLALSKKLINHKKTILPISIHRTGKTFLYAPKLQDNRNEALVSTMDIIEDEQVVEPNNGSDIFAISDSLDLTQTLLHVYSDLTNSLKSHKTRNQAFVDEHLGSLGVSTGSPTQTKDETVQVGSSTASSVDGATVLLALSCHNRIFQIWELLFEHTIEMIKYDIFSSLDWRAKRSCSQLKIGSFTPSSNSALMSAVVSVISGLVTALDKSLLQLVECIRDGSKGQGYSHETTRPHIDPKDQLYLVKNEADSLSLHLPACTATLSLSKQLLQSFDRFHTALSNAGLLQ
jgi:hypothetical protein